MKYIPYIFKSNFEVCIGYWPIGEEFIKVSVFITAIVNINFYATSKLCNFSIN